MAPLINRRLCAEIEGEFVLFLIGIRVNRPWKPWSWMPVFRAMPRMLDELARDPGLGLLHARTQFGFPNLMMVQYWRSHAHLQAFAEARDQTHLPAWIAFNKAVGTGGDVGIWHETYVMTPGRAESIYVNMPAYGMGKAGVLHDAKGARATASKRLAAGA
jgi:hypothetical protein